MEVSVPFVTVVALSVLLIQLFMCGYMFLSLRSSLREHSSLNKELFGLVRKIEGLTAERRQQFVLEFNRMVETINERVPGAVTKKAGEAIFHTESQILKHLAEIEPETKEDEQRKKRFDALIMSMEKLEETVISAASGAVKEVLAETRGELFEQREPERLRALRAH